MVAITCPWCEEDALLVLPDIQASRASFTCADCGTTVEFAEEAVALDLAA